MQSLWREAMLRALSSPSITRRPQSAYCTRSFQRLSQPEKTKATAIRDDTKVLQARIPNWKLEKSGVKRWGESSEAELHRVSRFSAQVGSYQGEGRRSGHRHQRTHRRDQPVRGQQNCG